MISFLPQRNTKDALRFTKEIPNDGISISSVYCHNSDLAPPWGGWGVKSKAGFWGNTLFKVGLGGKYLLCFLSLSPSQ
jgi:hypothetical protein